MINLLKNLIVLGMVENFTLIALIQFPVKVKRLSRQGIM